jgi:SWI/SNF-related matrix-associated actin-dependent regulator 1 of chromatin subfamily A
MPKLLTSLKPFQEEGVQYLCKHQKAILADSPGVGKTIEALETIRRLGAYPAIITAPSSLVPLWSMEIEKHFDGIKTNEVKKGTYGVAADIHIVSQDSIYSHESWLRKQKWASIICDEAHAFKQWDTRRTGVVLDLCKQVPVRYLLTGTPILNYPRELVTLLCALDMMSEFGGHYGFATQYCGGGSTYALIPAKLEKLNRDIRSLCLLRRTKEEVFPNFPKKTRVSTPINLPKDHELFRVINTTINRVRSKEIGPLVAVTKLREATGQAKVDYIVRYTKDKVLPIAEKVLIFAYHRTVQASLVGAFKGQCVSFPTKNLKRDLDRFQLDPDVRVAVCSIKAGSVGLTLTAAHHVIFAEYGWTPSDHEQAEDRTHRYGQLHDVVCHYPWAVRTLDEHMLSLLDQKSKLISLAISGKQVKSFLADRFFWGSGVFVK